MPRIIDLLLLMLAAPLLVPVFAILYLLVRMDVGAPAFFTQQRGGHKGVPFALYKFRTMTNARNDAGELLPDAERLTKLGIWLRSLSLDELPSLYNLLKGDIRLVGPRPFIADYLPLYSTHQMRRHDAVPGITGWAQVNGRNAISWEEKFELDIWYVENRSFWVDLKVLVLTVGRVLNRDGVSAVDDATMPRFEGSKNS